MSEVFKGDIIDWVRAGMPTPATLELPHGHAAGGYFDVAPMKGKAKDRYASWRKKWQKLGVADLDRNDHSAPEAAASSASSGDSSTPEGGTDIPRTGG